MGFFDLGRKEGFPTQYPEEKTPVTVDVLETGLILAFVILGTAFLIVIVGLSIKRSANALVRVFLSVSIGCCLLVGNFGQEWEVGSIETRTPYRAGSPHEISASIALKLGLRSINVTLKGSGDRNTNLENETINYNERFEWTWDQGRIGFGPYAGLLQRSFRAAQLKGLPIPILSVIEYFVIDGEGLRYGRFYRTAGWYTHILMWTAFATWIVANMFLVSVGRYASYWIALTGLLQILACIVWAIVRNPYPLVIPFDSGQITTSYGSNFWMVLICGLVCLLLAAILVIMDQILPAELANFLGIDPIDDYEQFLQKESEVDALQGEIGQSSNAHMMELEEKGSENSFSKKKLDRTVTVLKKRSSIGRFQKKSLIRLPQPRPPVSMQYESYDGGDQTHASQSHRNNIYETQMLGVPGTSGEGDMGCSTEALLKKPSALHKNE